jgi:hypothetical protein
MVSTRGASERSCLSAPRSSATSTATTSAPVAPVSSSSAVTGSRAAGGAGRLAGRGCLQGFRE